MGLLRAIKHVFFPPTPSGYQRQLNYQHSSGGYSTFGTGVENTWWEDKPCSIVHWYYNCMVIMHINFPQKMLHYHAFFGNLSPPYPLFFLCLPIALRLTAFVMRSFAKAKSFIYIDPANIEDSEAWLQSKQEQNGCFQMSGKLFHNRMKVFEGFFFSSSVFDL